MNTGALAWMPSRRSWMTWPISWTKQQDHEADRELPAPDQAVGGDRDEHRARRREQLEPWAAAAAAPCPWRQGDRAHAERRGCCRRRRRLRRLAGDPGSGAGRLPGSDARRHGHEAGATRRFGSRRAPAIAAQAVCRPRISAAARRGLGGRPRPLELALDEVQARGSRSPGRRGRCRRSRRAPPGCASRRRASSSR